MNRELLINLKLSSDWQAISKEDLFKIGIIDDDSLSCLGAYVYKYTPNNLVYLHNYGENYGEFLDEYLGMLYDNNSEDFIPSSVKQKLNINSQINSVYLKNHNLFNKNCLVNIFKLVSPESFSFCVQIFFHNKLELLAFNAIIPYIDPANLFKSIELSSPHILQFFKDIINFLNKI